MFRRTGLWAAGMLALGTLLGYAAAWGSMYLPEQSAAAQQTVAAKDPAACCDAPGRGAMLTSAPTAYQQPKAGNPRGATTGPTDAPGYDHPNQYLHMVPTSIAPNMEPVIVHP